MDATSLDSLERSMTAVARHAGPGRSDPGACVTDVADAPIAAVSD
jgi:hypothetical protein